MFRMPPVVMPETMKDELALKVVGSIASENVT